MEQDLYSRILGIAPGLRPPDHYTLLGLAWFEREPETIHRAGLQRLKALKSWDLHPDPQTQAAVQDLQNQVGTALATLEDETRRRAYELTLAVELGIRAPPVAAGGPPAEPQGAPPVAGEAGAALPPPAALPAAVPAPAPRPARRRWLARAAALLVLACAAVGLPTWLLASLWVRLGQATGAGLGPRPGDASTGAVGAARVEPTAVGAAGTPVAGQPWRLPETGMEFVWVAPGSFVMGSNGGAPDELPLHPVRISRGFWLGRVEVTQPQYWAICGKRPSRFRGPLNPVESVSWRDAVGYAMLLTIHERSAGRLPAGYEYRLPTEAEWEYAARGGDRSRGYLYAGSNAADEVAWYLANSWQTPCPVGQKRPNELGLCDLSGNVWEWCLDGYEAGAYATSPATDPLNLRVTVFRVVRGGSWYQRAVAVRSTARDRREPATTSETLGFRLCLAPAVGCGESAADLARALLSSRAAGDEEPAASAGPIEPEADSAAPPEVAESPAPAGPLEGQRWAVPELEMPFAWVAAGEFRMGSNGGAPDEQPEHLVRLSHGFWLGRYEVTQAEYEALTGSNPSRFKGPRHPVETVSWTDAAAFCAKLTERERAASRLPARYEYRLPTEAEWEYAAQGGEWNRHLLYSGSNHADEVAWHAGNSGGTTHPVGQKQANELGLFDLSGNVWEWCLDGYDEAFYAASPAVNPVNLQTTGTRVYRGGSWGIEPRDVRSVYRNRGRPDAAISGLGFRVCLGPLPSRGLRGRFAKP